MKTIEVTEKEVKAAFDVAKTDEVKQVLAALFCKPENKVIPSLDDYKTIKSYEDACEALGISPIAFGDNDTFIGELDDDCQDYGCKVAELPKHIIALLKLETISRALWGKGFQPKPDANGSSYYYYPWFALYTKEEINNMNDEQRGALLSAHALSGANAGFGSLGTHHRSSYAIANLGFRLCQETDEKATYFGRQFTKLWADYLEFNFTVGDKLK